MHIEPLRTSEPRHATGSRMGGRSLPRRYTFLSQDRALRFAAESCIEVLKAANRLTGSETYEWTLGAGEETDLHASPAGPGAGLVLIGGTETPWMPSPAALPQLRAGIRSSARLCVVGSAVFVPLAAGLLRGDRVAVHPRFHPGMRESATEIEIAAGATSHHRTLSSAVSPAAAIRMMVELIGAREGDYTRSALAEYLGLSDHRMAGPFGRHWQFKRLARGDAVISGALDIMRDHLEDTLTVGQISEILGVSSRKLERGFRDRLNRSPLKVYRDLRLDQVRELLCQTSMPMHVVSIACGFSSATLMKKWYLHRFGETPAETREIAFRGRSAA